MISFAIIFWIPVMSVWMQELTAESDESGFDDPELSLWESCFCLAMS